MSEATIKIRPSWRSYWASWIALAITLVAGLAGPTLFLSQVSVPDDEITRSVFEYAPLAVSALATLLLIKWILIPWLANRYFFTGEAGKVQEVYGILKRERKTTYLHDVRTAEDQQGVWGRIFGFGDVVLYTAGSGEEDIRLKGIGKPAQWAAEFDHHIRNRVDGSDDAEANRYNPDARNTQPDTQTQQTLARLSNRVEKLEDAYSKLENRLSYVSGRLAATQEAASASESKEEEGEYLDNETDDLYAHERPMFAQPSGEHEQSSRARGGLTETGQDWAAQDSPETTHRPAGEPGAFESDEDLFGTPAPSPKAEPRQQESQPEPEPVEQAINTPDPESDVDTQHSHPHQESSETDNNDPDSVGVLG